MAASLEPARVAEVVEAQGIATIPSFLSAGELAQLSALFDAVMADGAPSHRVKDHPPGKLLRVSTEGDSKLSRTAAELFNAPQLNAIRAILFQHEKEAPITVREMIATYDFRGGAITDVHFDTMRALKFMVYLDDTTEQNGAFRYAAGTHLANAEYRRRWLAAGRRVKDLPNIKGEHEVVDLQSFALPKGSLLIFDTEGFHAGGLLQAGRTRRVLRGGTLYPGQPLLQPPRLSKQWFRDKWSVVTARAPVETLGRLATQGRARKT